MRKQVDVAERNSFDNKKSVKAIAAAEKQWQDFSPVYFNSPNFR
jgi:hypothetical protein